MQDTATKAAGPGSGAGTAQGESAQQSGYYGLRILPPLSAVAELATIVSVLLAVDWIWPALDINNLQPSPYWLPVLLLTLQYGTASGTLAVIVAIVAYFSFVTLPEQGVGENEFAYRLRILSQPILWIATAVLLGQFRMVQISAKRELRQRLSELVTQRDTLADYASRLRTRCDGLERDIAARPMHAGAPLLNAFASLADQSRPGSGIEFQKAVEGAFAQAFPAATVSLFARSDLGLVKAASSPWPADAVWAVTLPSDHKLTKAMLSAKARLSILDPAAEQALDGQGLAAVPVVEPPSGRVVGMLKVEFADATVLNADLLRQLDVLAAAIQPGLVHSQAGATTAVAATPRRSEPAVGERDRLKVGF